LPATPYAGPGPGVCPTPGNGMAPGSVVVPPVLDGDGDDSAIPCDDQGQPKKTSGGKKPNIDWQPAYAGCGPCLYIDGEYLSWRYKDMPVTVPLLTTGPVTNPPSAGFGILGNMGTQVLYGNETLGLGYTPGARVTIGGWLDSGYHLPGVCPAIGLEASYLTLGRVATHFDASSNSLGSPLLARPVVDTTTGSETVLLVSAPSSAGGPAGAIAINTATELWGAEANAFVPLFGCKYLMAGGLGGFRYVNFEEGLQIDQNSRLLSNGIAFFNGATVTPPARINILDDFETRNNFYGAQVGAQVLANVWRFSFTGVAKIALGTMHEQALISGSTTLHKAPFGTLTTQGGALALASNSGGFGHYEFAAVPEATGKVTFAISDKINVFVGYTFLYLSDVQRPGNLIDRNVNPTQLPTSQSFGTVPAGPPVPAFNFVRSEFWVQGITMGLGLAF
jgi:hypothetical protein